MTEPVPYWTAFYVKSRAEKKTADRLQEQGFQTFCPVVEEVREWSDRKKKVKVPLFRSYLFAKVTEQERLEILQDHGVVASVMWLKKPAVIREEEIEGIKAMLGERSQIKLETYKRYQRGDLVQINDGPFQGNNALLLDVKRNKVIVRIEGLQLQLAIQLRPEQLGKKIVR